MDLVLAHAQKLCQFQPLCRLCVEHVKKATKESGLIFAVSQHPVYQIQGMHVDLNVCAKKTFIQIVNLTTACFKIQDKKAPVNNDLEK